MKLIVISIFLVASTCNIHSMQPHEVNYLLRTKKRLVHSSQLNSEAPMVNTPTITLEEKLPSLRRKMAFATLGCISNYGITCLMLAEGIHDTIAKDYIKSGFLFANTAFWALSLPELTHTYWQSIQEWYGYQQDSNQEEV